MCTRGVWNKHALPTELLRIRHVFVYLRVSECNLYRLRAEIREIFSPDPPTFAPQPTHNTRARSRVVKRSQGVPARTPSRLLLIMMFYINYKINVELLSNMQYSRYLSVWLSKIYQNIHGLYKIFKVNNNIIMRVIYLIYKD